MEGERYFYRYMSRGEARAVGASGDIGYLRGGRPGETYWTSELYDDAWEAKARLALEEVPEVRMRFTIKSWPSRMLKEGSSVGPNMESRVPEGSSPFVIGSICLSFT